MVSTFLHQARPMVGFRCTSSHVLLHLGQPAAADKLVFANPASRMTSLSDMSLIGVVRKMEFDWITVHGFRSTFRDWAGETTHYPREVIEAALAHQLKDKAEAAYARGDLFDKRRQLMSAWAIYANP